ncbi:POK18 protein, partial [Sakesphorus luctuosus]|nr:POK18 protein [Sakesphorus luctuosus]NXG12783.1 POK18 protein [Sakesphorus luctuosus]
WTYLGWRITHSIVKPQKMEITSSVTTLNDAQRLVGELQWIRPVVGLTNADIYPLLSLLRGTKPNEP